MVEPTLNIIDLDIVEFHYIKFLSAWVYKGEEGNFLLDPGPSCSIPDLLQGLADLGVQKLDWVLLTHVHMDHSGGVGHLIKEFPDAQVAVHPKGKVHILDPERLWEDSLKFLGRVAKAYGKPIPVPEENVHVLDEVPFGTGIKVIDTPGHASHHQCFVYRDWFFVGELLGVTLPLDEGLYLRPATPKRFILEQYLESMEKVKPHITDILCFSHYGMQKNGRTVLESAREQLNLWVDVIERNRSPGEVKPDLSKIIDAILQEDPYFSKVRDLSPELNDREMRFFLSSIDGIYDYLENR